MLLASIELIQHRLETHCIDIVDVVCYPWADKLPRDFRLLGLVPFGSTMKASRLTYRHSVVSNV